MPAPKNGEKTDKKRRDRTEPIRIRGCNRSMIYNGIQAFLDAVGMTREMKVDAERRYGIHLKTIPNGRSVLVDGNDAAEWLLAVAKAKQEGLVTWDRQRAYDQEQLTA